MLASLDVMAALVVGTVGLFIVKVLEVVRDDFGTVVVDCCVVGTVLETALVVITDVAVVVRVGGTVVGVGVVVRPEVTAVNEASPPVVNEVAVAGVGEVTSLLPEQIPARIRDRNVTCRKYLLGRGKNYL